jgi:hypothetical protein
VGRGGKKRESLTGRLGYDLLAGSETWGLTSNHALWSAGNFWDQLTGCVGLSCKVYNFEVISHKLYN